MPTLYFELDIKYFQTILQHKNGGFFLYGQKKKKEERRKKKKKDFFNKIQNNFLC